MLLQAFCHLSHEALQEPVDLPLADGCYFALVYLIDLHDLHHPPVLQPSAVGLALRVSMIAAMHHRGEFTICHSTYHNASAQMPLSQIFIPKCRSIATCCVIYCR